MLETLDPQPILSDHDSDEADVEEVQKSSIYDHSSVADDVSDNQNGSGKSTVSVRDTPPCHHDSVVAQQKNILMIPK